MLTENFGHSSGKKTEERQRKRLVMINVNLVGTNFIGQIE